MISTAAVFAPATPLAPSFAGVYLSSIAVYWTAIPGSEYIAVLSTNSDYSGPVSSSALTANSQTFTGLVSGTSYYFEVKLSTENDNAYLANRISTVTIAVDTTPPVTHLRVTGPDIADGATSGIFDNDNIAITAEDDGSGVAGVYYTVNTAFSSSSTAVEYLASFTLAPGTHTVYYTAFDNAGNMAGIKSATLVVSHKYDTIPPVSTLKMSGGHYVDGRGDFVSASTVLSFYATDNAPGGVNSGVQKVYYKAAGPADPLPEALNAQTTVFFNTEPPDFSLPEGEWRVAYGALDNAGNYEQLKVETIRSDGTPPVVSASVSGTVGQNGWYVSEVAGVVDSTDALSGMREVFYVLDNSGRPGPRGVYHGGGSIAGEDGIYSLSLLAYDNVGNRSEQNVGFKIDKTPPATRAAINGNCYMGDCDPGVRVALNSSDGMSGPAKIYYSLDNAAYGDYAGPIAFNADGQYTPDPVFANVSGSGLLVG